MYSCLNQHCPSLWPIRQHQLQYPPKRLCSLLSGWNPNPLCILSVALCATLSKVVWHSITFSTFHKAFTKWTDESSLILVITRKLLGCSDGTDSFEFHHLRVHRLVSRTPSAFLFHCRRLMHGSGDVNVGCSDSKGLSHSELPSHEGLPCLKAASVLCGSHTSTRFIFCKATLTVCTPDLQVPDLQWTIGTFGNPDSCCLHQVVC